MYRLKYGGLRRIPMMQITRKIPIMQILKNIFAKISELIKNKYNKLYYNKIYYNNIKLKRIF